MVPRELTPQAARITAYSAFVTGTEKRSVFFSAAFNTPVQVAFVKEQLTGVSFIMPKQGKTARKKQS